MMRGSIISALATLLLLPPYITLANPVPPPSGHALVPRALKGYIDCSDDQKERLGRALADATTLAEFAFNINTASKPWSHYFRTEGDGKEEDVKYATKVWSAIANNNDPTNPEYEFSIRCGKDATPGCESKDSAAWTNPYPQDGDTPREIVICPPFFKDSFSETNNDLSSRNFERPKRNQHNSWCAPGNNFPWYEVAGHTILHEMTHLDALGKAAELPEMEAKDGDKTFMTHATEDVLLPGLYPVAARGLAEIWQNGKNDKDTIKPYQNAESIAGAALEWYMTYQCDLSGNPIQEIPL